MHIVTIESDLQYLTMDELVGDQRELVWQARRAAAHAYSPYSRFCVGAAIRLTNGRIVTASNHENISYGLTSCAERNAIFAATHVAWGNQHISILAVAARPAGVDEAYKGNTPVVPCGACRQIIKEAEDLAGNPIVILMDCFNDTSVVRVCGIETLLPLPFGPANLKVKPEP